MAHSGQVIYMRTIPDKGDGWRALCRPLRCTMWPGWQGSCLIPENFEWDGHSAGLLSFTFPRWNHPLASIKHDHRCRLAENAEQRAWADREFRRDVGTTSWAVTKWWGYFGVRAGAFLGIGNRF